MTNIYAYICMLLFWSTALYCPDAVTYNFSGGRFGDNLIAFSQAFWLHYKYGFDLLFKPFTHSDQLNMHYRHSHYDEAMAKQYTRTVYVRTKFHPFSSPDESFIYNTMFKQDPGVDWSDGDFVEAFRQEIMPVDSELYLQPINTDTHTIALHIRRGGSFGYDKRIRASVPQQFPSLSFYYKALTILLDHIVGDCTVYLFTDDTHPMFLAKRIHRKLSAEHQKRITWIYNTAKNDYYTNVLLDFFTMMQCSYLVRPASHFSLFAELLGVSAVCIAPAKTRARKNNWGKVIEFEITVFGEDAPQKERIVWKAYKGVKNISILQSNDIKICLTDPTYKPQKRQLLPQLPACY